jgi:hypothetical protein
MRRQVAILLLPLLAAWVAGHRPVGAQEVAGRAGPANAIPAKSVDPSAWRSLASALPELVPVQTLPSPDVAALLAEDQARDTDKSLRTGIGREITTRMSEGRWDRLASGGWVWRADVVSMQAKAVRLHFDGIRLPEGAELVVQSAADPAQVAGPFVGRGPAGDGQLWTIPLAGERVRVEYFVPGDGESPPGDDAFVVDQLVHVYRDLLADRDALVPDEGNCYNDVTCFPDWSDVARAVARIDYVSGGSSLSCCGQLLNTMAGDLTPYFLTSHICISTAAEANSTVIYWLYQTPSCNGTPPALGSVPSSSYCTLLSTNAASDYTLLMVEGVIPSTVLRWVGWTLSHPATGAGVACIHHPGTAYKRISFGTFATDPICNGPMANHVRANWTTSVTEAGSAGGGLFRSDSQQLIGQLHCGLSYCGAPAGDLHDSFGDFAVTYSGISGFVAGGSDDALEDNDACASARTVGLGTFNGLVVKSVDPDWYRVHVPANQRVTVTLNFTHAWGDIDCDLRGSCGGTALVTSNGTSNSEVLDYENLGAAQDFLISVHLFPPDTRNQYDMTITEAALPNLNAMVTPSGFASPAVPRDASGATYSSCPLTPTLEGNTVSTYLNWAIQNEGPGTVPQAWESRLYVDEGLLYWTFGVGANNPGGYSCQGLNCGPNAIPGGRHSLTSYADYSGTVPESNEGDNVWRGQWVWSPLVTQFQVPNLRSVPPPADFEYYSLPNSDGFQFTRSASYAWVVSEAGLTPGDDYDLFCYSDYSGSTSGFSTILRASTMGSNFTDFVVGHYQGTPTTVYPATVRYLDDGGGHEFVQDQSDARFRNGPVDHSLWAGQVMDANRLADVYEAPFVSGQTYQIYVSRTAGTTPLGFDVFPGTSGKVWSRGDATASGEGVPLAPTLTYLSYTATESGYHPIVVYRNQGTDAGTPVTYTIGWGYVVGVPLEGETAVLGFDGVKPNPVAATGTFEFSLATAGEVRLAIYDLGGRRVRNLVDAAFGAGRHPIPWDGRGDTGERLGAGVYWAKFEAGGRIFTRRMVVLR